MKSKKRKTNKKTQNEATFLGGFLVVAMSITILFIFLGIHLDPRYARLYAERQTINPIETITKKYKNWKNEQLQKCLKENHHTRCTFYK